MKRIPDVLDVWFDAGLAGWASLGYPKNKTLFKKLWPSDFQTEGPDQIRGWWNAELITSVITFGEAPFTNILFHGFILDAHGVKMSKSKGNIVEPEDVIEKYGRDVLRSYLLSSAPWSDFYFKWADVEAVARSLNVIENSFAFVKTYATKVKAKPKKLNPEDRWILSRLNRVTKNCGGHFRGYNAYKAAAEIHDFLVNDFSRWYIKIIRDRVWPAYAGKDKQAAFYTLYEVASKSVKMLAPITPFIAEQISRDVLAEKESVHVADWPKADEKIISDDMEKAMEAVKNIVETANAQRHESKIKIRWPLSKLTIDSKENARMYGDVIKTMCNVKSVVFGELEEGTRFSGGRLLLDTALTEDLKKEAMLREVVRKVQEMRKKAGLVVADKIGLKIDGAGELKKFSGALKKEVGASKVIFGPAKQDFVDFDGRKIGLEIRKLK